MEDIALKIRRHRQTIEKETEQIRSSSVAIRLAKRYIRRLQNSCSHTWKFFFQVNDFHMLHWNVVYKCTECDAEKTVKGAPPVCEVCDCHLERAEKDDVEAETERQKPEHRGGYNPPLAFRCPECKKIHILRHLGD